MNFIEFRRDFRQRRVIDIRNVVNYFGGIDRRRLYEWQKKGYLVRLVNNFYLFLGESIDDKTLRIIASQIYKPSYIGLESALAFYHFIPEAVLRAVSLTTKRNKTIKTYYGDFQYRSIKPSLFFGYDCVDSMEGSFFISDPEKTLLDFLYFKPGSDQVEVLEEMRFNAEEISGLICIDKIKNYLTIFSSPKLERATRYLMEVLHVEYE